MIDFGKALKIVMDNIPVYEKKEIVAINECCGRVLAENIIADRPAPPFNRVAVDGYACKKEDIGKELAVIEVVPAGKRPEKIIGSGQCSKVMTGCMLPEGTEMVFMIEIAKGSGSGKVMCVEPEKAVRSENYSKTGEDAKKGDILVPKGTIVFPRHIPSIASSGYSSVNVMKKPVIGIIATGDELVEPSQQPLLHQIRNSNSWQLAAQVERAGGEPKYYGIVKDDALETEKILMIAKEQCDIILMSGGVSAGDFDFVPDALKNTGFKIIFDSVAVKPGKPTTFAVSNDAICFGMPGNPVSTYVIFEMVVTPFLAKMVGAEHKPFIVEMTLESGFKRKRTERTEFVPVKMLNSRTVSILEYHGSGHLTSLSNADGLVMIEKGIDKIEKDQKVETIIF